MCSFFRCSIYTSLIFLDKNQTKNCLLLVLRIFTVSDTFNTISVTMHIESMGNISDEFKTWQKIMTLLSASFWKMSQNPYKFQTALYICCKAIFLHN